MDYLITTIIIIIKYGFISLADVSLSIGNTQYDI